jgi:hypothetical protein
MRLTGNDQKEIYGRFKTLNEAGPVANMGRGVPGSTVNQINVGSAGPVIPKSPIAALKGEVPNSGGVSAEQEEIEDNENLEMIKNQLLSCSDKAIEIYDMIQNQGHGLEPWAFAKVTLAEDYINVIHDYLKYRNENNISSGREIETDIVDTIG